MQKHMKAMALMLTITSSMLSAAPDDVGMPGKSTKPPLADVGFDQEGLGTSLKAKIDAANGRIGRIDFNAVNAKETEVAKLLEEGTPEARGTAAAKLRENAAEYGRLADEAEKAQDSSEGVNGAIKGSRIRSESTRQHQRADAIHRQGALMKPIEDRIQALGEKYGKATARGDQTAADELRDAVQRKMQVRKAAAEVGKRLVDGGDPVNTALEGAFEKLNETWLDKTTGLELLRLNCIERQARDISIAELLEMTIRLDEVTKLTGGTTPFDTSHPGGDDAGQDILRQALRLSDKAVRTGGDAVPTSGVPVSREEVDEELKKYATPPASPPAKR